MKDIIKNILGYFSIPFTKILASNPSITVLIFHHIDGENFSSFKKLMVCLDKEVGFINPSDLDSFYSGRKRIASKKILLTFDDGFISNYHLAIEILDLLNIKAIFFVIPNFALLQDRNKQLEFMQNNILVNNSDLDNHEMFPMSYENMRQLIKNGHLIGSHTLNHQSISKLQSEDDLYNEIVTSKLTLEKELNTSIDHFAFPFGDINSISSIGVKLANKNYLYVHSGVRGLNTLEVRKKILWRESLHLENNIYYNLFVSINGISFKDKNIRNKIRKLSR